METFTERIWKDAIADFLKILLAWLSCFSNILNIDLKQACKLKFVIFSSACLLQFSDSKSIEVHEILETGGVRTASYNPHILLP